MKPIIANHMLAAAAQMERIDAILHERKKQEDFDANSEVPTSLRNFVAACYSKLVDSAVAIGAQITANIATDVVARLRKRKKPVSFADMGSLSNEVAHVMEYELQAVKLYCLNPGADAYYSPEGPLFGTEVEARITKASDDISEAGKCFGVGRYTASVFHLMRAMEAAVQKLSEQLGIDNIEREWGKLLSDIGAKIQAMPKGDARDECSRAHVNLYHVKQAWRNDTMHPKATYTEEEAREVFDAMKAFMRHLASMLPPSVEELIG